MRFNTINALCAFFFALLVGGGMASPVAENSLEPRVNLGPISVGSTQVGGNQVGGCPQVGQVGQVGGPVTQSNRCSSGTAFCCSPTDSGHTCVNTTTTCDNTVICCNNNGNGTQICIGTANINLNLPITINLIH
ncbi:hypothetical protein V8E54_007366 [Elaphomyces granulatus]